jgi:toxin ParE1/3/4
MALRLRPEAREDLDAAARWYEAQAKGLGRQFLAEVRLVFQRIRTNPDAYPLTYRGTRRALIRRFPYGVIFVPLAQQDCIVVLAVLHCGRNPRLWRQRSRI